MNRAEAILESILKTLRDLESTQCNIERDRIYPPEDLPALSVNQGSETPAGESTMQFQDVILDVSVEIYLKSSALNTLLNTIKSEVYAALLSSPQLNLPFVLNTHWRGDTAPDVSGDAERPTSRCRMRFEVHYRHSYTSKEE